MKHRAYRMLTAITISACLLFAGCGSSSNNNHEVASIRIAFFPNITHAQALYGKNTGRFQESFGEDVTVQWIEFNAGPSEIEAMFAGEVDIGYIGPIPAINGSLTSNGDVQVISGASNAGAVLVTRPDLQLTSIEELSGLKVAIPQLGNTQHISLLKILKENGLQTTDKGGTVEVVAAANADAMTFLDRGEIDAALVPEPWGARMESEIGANLFLDEKQVWRDGNYPVAVIIVNKDFRDVHPELVETFLRTHLKITDEINQNVDAKSIINDELLNLTGKALEESVLEKAFNRVVITTTIDPQVMDDFIAILKENGFTSKDGKGEEIVDSQLLDTIKAEGVEE